MAKREVEEQDLFDPSVDIGVGTTSWITEHALQELGVGFDDQPAAAN